MAEQPLSPAEIAAAEQNAAKEGFLKHDLIALDQFGNVLLLKGLPDETISAHSERAAEQGELWGKVMVHMLNWFQKNHGVKAVAGDASRAQVVEQVETKALATEDQALGVKK